MVRALLVLLVLGPACWAGQSAVSVPSSAVVLQRARALEVPPAVLAGALQASGGLAQAVQAFEALGVLEAGEVNAADAEQALAMRHVLQAVWRESAPSVQAPEVDASWSVPAVVVRAPEATYYLHGVSHGFTGSLSGKAARRLERQVWARGKTLVVEQSLPAAFRLAKASEVVDRPEDRVWPGLTRWLSRLLPLGRRFHAFYFRFLASLARRQGNADLAAHLSAVADRVFARKPDPAGVLPLDLPLLLKEDVEPGLVARSRALAQAALAAADGAGGAVHVLSGWSHVPDLLALLGPKSGTQGPRAQ